MLKKEVGIEITDMRLRTNSCALSSSWIPNNAPLFFRGERGNRGNSNCPVFRVQK
jgi:hypothetical protein